MKFFQICSKKIMLFLAFLPLVGSAQVINKSISFPEGKSSIVINGTIAGDQTIDYALGTDKGQQIKVDLTNTTKAYFNVLPPESDDVAVFIGQNEGNSCSITSNFNGVYKIRVYQMRSSARRGEKANFTLKVSLASNNANSSSSIDAKVAGTNYHATGELRAAIGSTPKSAKFGVIRSNGGAEVHATLPGKSKRVFVFSQGEWSCKSANCKLTFAKISSDEWELIVNDSEKYYIVDAVIYGG